MIRIKKLATDEHGRTRINGAHRRHRKTQKFLIFIFFLCILCVLWALFNPAKEFPMKLAKVIGTVVANEESR